jgi:hypothetical protein
MKRLPQQHLFSDISWKSGGGSSILEMSIDRDGRGRPRSIFFGVMPVIIMRKITRMVTQSADISHVRIAEHGMILSRGGQDWSPLRKGSGFILIKNILIKNRRSFCGFLLYSRSAYDLDAVHLFITCFTLVSLLSMIVILLLLIYIYIYKLCLRKNATLDQVLALL